MLVRSISGLGREVLGVISWERIMVSGGAVGVKPDFEEWSLAKMIDILKLVAGTYGKSRC